MRRVGLGALALAAPPLALWLAGESRAWLLGVGGLWLVALAVFFGAMAGPGFALLLLAAGLAQRRLFRRAPAAVRGEGAR